MSEQVQSIVDEIRRALLGAAQSGDGEGMPEQLLWVPRDGVRIVRFLTEFSKDEIIKVTMHDKFRSFYPQPCLKHYGEPCPFCGAKGVRTTTQYVFTVFDYDSGSKKIVVFKASPGAALEDLMNHYDVYGTIKDRDFNLKKLGVGPRTRVRASPATPTPTPYTGTLSKPFSEVKVLEILKPLIRQRTLPEGVAPGSDDEEEEE